jgi:hypothetical protein
LFRAPPIAARFLYLRDMMAGGGWVEKGTEKRLPPLLAGSEQ